MSKSWTDLSDEDFEQVLDNLSDPEYGQLTDAEFFGALSAMDEADEIKLTAHLSEGGKKSVKRIRNRGNNSSFNAINEKWCW
jgi:hypothetical protein